MYEDYVQTASFWLRSLSLCGYWYPRLFEKELRHRWSSTPPNHLFLKQIPVITSFKGNFPFARSLWTTEGGSRWGVMIRGLLPSDQNLNSNPSIVPADKQDCEQISPELPAPWQAVPSSSHWTLTDHPCPSMLGCPVSNLLVLFQLSLVTLSTNSFLVTVNCF